MEQELKEAPSEIVEKGTLATPNERFDKIFCNSGYEENMLYLASELLGISYITLEREAIVIPLKYRHSILLMYSLYKNYLVHIVFNSEEKSPTEIMVNNYEFGLKLFLDNYNKNDRESLKLIQYNLDASGVFNHDGQVLERVRYMDNSMKIPSYNLKIVHLNLKKMREKWLNNDIDKKEVKFENIMGFSSLLLANNKEEFQNSLDRLEVTSKFKENVKEIMKETFFNKY